MRVGFSGEDTKNLLRMESEGGNPYLSYVRDSLDQGEAGPDVKYALYGLLFPFWDISLYRKTPQNSPFWFH
jgi:hypothetical protein